MDWLGLGPDDAYDDYDTAQEPERPSKSPRHQRDEPAPRGQRGYQGDYESDGTVRTMPARPELPDPRRRSHRSPSRARHRRLQRAASARSTLQRQAPVNSADPYTVRPRRFDSAQEVADKFKEGQPVIMNLEASDREVSRRLIDFASGLCYGLNGTMEKVATGVYLLKPIPPRKGGYDSGEFDS